MMDVEATPWLDALNAVPRHHPAFLAFCVQTSRTRDIMLPMGLANNYMKRVGGEMRRFQTSHS